MKKVRNFPELNRLPKKGYYPWDLLFDGSVWEIGSDDLRGTAASFAHTAAERARIRGIPVRIMRDDQHVWIQAFPTD